MTDYDDLIEQTCARLNIVDFLDHYGIKVGHTNKINCPFHPDKTASCHIYRKDNRYHCFGCGKGGDVVWFAKNFYEMKLPETLERLNAEFNLNLPIGRPMSIRESQLYYKRLKERKRREAIEKRRRDKAYLDYWNAHHKFRLCDLWRVKYAPKKYGETLDRRYVKAIYNYDTAKHQLEQAELTLIALDYKPRTQLE